MQEDKLPIHMVLDIIRKEKVLIDFDDINFIEKTLFKALKLIHRGSTEDAINTTDNLLRALDILREKKDVIFNEEDIEVPF